MDTGTWVKEVERITREAAVAEKKIVEVGGLVLSTVPLHDTRKPEPLAKPVRLSTLESLVEYVRARPDAPFTTGRNLFLHVESPSRVSMLTGMFGDMNERAVLVEVVADVPALRFMDFLDPETFVIEIATLYEDSPSRAAVLAVVGNLTTEAVQTVADDGLSQTATARKGIVARQAVPVPNPVLLRPHRTFAEIAQPESPFVLRLRGGGEGRQPACALFEADGGRWRLDATARIKAYLKTELAGTIEVFG